VKLWIELGYRLLPYPDYQNIVISKEGHIQRGHGTFVRKDEVPGDKLQSVDIERVDELDRRDWRYSYDNSIVKRKW